MNRDDGADLLAVREAQAREILRELGGVLIALSGGVDSGVLAALAARELGERAVAVTALSAVYPGREIELARKLTAHLGLEHLLVPFDHLTEVEGFADNPPDRCYRCKKAIFARLQELARQRGLVLVHGEQADDLALDRPGHQAAVELGARAPLAEAGLTKVQVRELARRFDLPVADAPPMACLATRFPYHTHLTRDALARAEAAEKVLADLGFSNYRARCHGDLVRVVVPPEEIGRLLDEDLRGRLVEQMKKLGFVYVTADLSGYGKE